MSLFDPLRKRGAARPEPNGDEPAHATDDSLPIERYDRLDSREVIELLHELPQTDLAAIETYERSHAGRHDVLTKLRWLRGPEPFEGYDGLAADEVAAALEGADGPTISAARAYELKMRHRTTVLADIERLRLERPSQAAEAAERQRQHLGIQDFLEERARNRD